MTSPRPDELLQIARAYTEARILLTGAELDLFTLLAGEPLDAEEVSARRSADLRATTILLDALAAMGLLRKTDGRYRCEPAISPLLSSAAAGSVRPMLLHHANLWHKWSALTDIVRGRIRPPAELHLAEGANVPAEPPPSGTRSADEERAFIEAMAVVAGPLADGIVKAVGVGDAERLLDIGAGPGTFTQAFLRASPRLRATVFDLPSVIEITRAHLRAAGFEGRVQFVGGDFNVDDLPPDHDFALLSAIIHQNSPVQNVYLYRKVHRALRLGGRIVIRDHILRPDRTGSRPAVVFAVNMLVATEGGNCYTFDEIRTGLEEAGFQRVRLLQEAEHMAGLVEGFKGTE